MSNIERTVLAVCAFQLAGCAADPAATEPGPARAWSAESQRELAARDSFEDELGLRWVRVGPAAALDYPDDHGHEESTPPTPGLGLANTSVEGVADLLAPHAEFAGMDFALDAASAMRFAREIQRIARETRADDEAGLSGADNVPPSRSEGELTPRAIVGGTDDRLNWNHAAGSYPHDNTAAMFGAGTCTCHKLINNFTCVTAAHCLHDGRSDRAAGWRARHELQFAAGSSAPLAVIPADCYNRWVPGGWNGVNRDYDYAVIALRGRNGAFCDLESYDVGAYGWNATANNATVFGTVTGYPSTAPLPAGFSYPTLSLQTCSGYQPSSAAAQIYNFCDVTGGNSGGAYYSAHTAGQGTSYRVRGIVWGGNSFESKSVRITSALIATLTSAAGY